MSDVGDAIDEARQELSEAAGDFLPDTCTVMTPGVVTNTGDGTHNTGEPSTVANVPCKYEPLSAYERQAGGALVAGADYKLEFPVFWEGAPLAVAASAEITVAARGLNPALTFLVVGLLGSSMGLMQRVTATLA